MSTLLVSLLRENPLPGLALASLNLIEALSLVALSLVLVTSTLGTIGFSRSSITLSSLSDPLAQELHERLRLDGLGGEIVARLYRRLRR